MSTYILVVDDDSEIRDVIHIYLRNEGYDVIEAENGHEAVECLKRQAFDVIIMDIMMPNLDGVQACLNIRQQSNVPIIMLSARTEDLDKITGLSSGADDYMTKPFNPLELVARVKAQLRRNSMYVKSAQEEDNIQIGGLVIDPDRHKVTVDGRDVKLTPTEFAILELLASNPNIVFNTDKIYERVWKDPSLSYTENTVMAHIRNLREKIEKDPRKPMYIKTVWGVGYKIEQ